jgi:hypothetical protein
VTPDQYVKNAKLAATFNVLATNLDRAGRIFVSQIEGKKLPFYGSQVCVSALFVCGLCADD